MPPDTHNNSSVDWSLVAMAVIITASIAFLFWQLV